MKTLKITTILASLLILLSSCQKQTPVELVDDTDDSNLINVQSLTPTVDSLFLVSEEDSSGNASMLNSKFFGKMVHQAIRIDRPIRSDSFIIAEAIFLDKRKPISHNNRIIAYHSLDIGTLQFNNQIMNKLQRGITIPTRGDSIIGFRYFLRTTYEYNQIINWSTTGTASFPPFEFNTSAPSQIRVTNLKPGIINISEPLNIKWECSNPEVNLFISAEVGTFQQRKLIPVLHLKIKNKKGEVTIPVRILELLPAKRYSRYMFTFTSESRLIKEIDGYTEKVLVYNASVHSILLNIQQ